MTRRIDAIAGRRRQTRQTLKKSAPKSKIGLWLAATLVIASVAGLTYAYRHSIQVAPTDSTPATTQNLSTEPNANDPVLFPADSEVTVDAYDSGAGEAITTDALKKIQAAGFSSRFLHTSQLTYDKTYIWYAAQYEAEAKQVAAVLADRQVVLKLSQVSGNSGMLIYFGKQ